MMPSVRARYTAASSASPSVTEVTVMRPRSRQLGELGPDARVVEARVTECASRICPSSSCST